MTSLCLSVLLIQGLGDVARCDAGQEHNFPTVAFYLSITYGEQLELQGGKTIE